MPQTITNICCYRLPASRLQIRLSRSVLYQHLSAKKTNKHTDTKTSRCTNKVQRLNFIHGIGSIQNSASPFNNRKAFTNDWRNFGRRYFITAVFGKSEPYTVYAVRLYRESQRHLRLFCGILSHYHLYQPLHFCHKCSIILKIFVYFDTLFYFVSVNIINIFDISVGFGERKFSIIFPFCAYTAIDIRITL